MIHYFPVICGGIAGASTAFELAEQGKAQLVEAKRGEEICPINSKDACETVPFPRPVRAARALAVLTADLCTAV